VLRESWPHREERAPAVGPRLRLRWTAEGDRPYVVRCRHMKTQAASMVTFDAA